uniref:Uncharacterized protein n=1 Tax=Arundo donax TaxID=35708 RepID=A0A0A9SJX0_ARUDO
MYGKQDLLVVVKQILELCKIMLK